MRRAVVLAVTATLLLIAVPAPAQEWPLTGCAQRQDLERWPADKDRLLASGQCRVLLPADWSIAHIAAGKTDDVPSQVTFVATGTGRRIKLWTDACLCE